MKSILKFIPFLFLIGCASSSHEAKISPHRIHAFNKFSPEKLTLLMVQGAGGSFEGEFPNLYQPLANDYNVIYYLYDHTQPLDKIMTALTVEARNYEFDGMVAYSYGDVVLRSAILDQNGQNAFTNKPLIELAPTFGGSRLAEGVNRGFKQFGLSIVNLFSPVKDISEAQDPSGETQASLFSEQAVSVFNSNFPQRLVVRVAGDRHEPTEPGLHQIYRDRAIGHSTSIVLKTNEAGDPHSIAPRLSQTVKIVKNFFKKQFL